MRSMKSARRLRSCRQSMTAGVSARLITRFSAPVSDGHQREVLVDHADAERPRVARVADSVGCQSTSSEPASGW